MRKERKMMRKTNGKKEGLWHKTMEKNGKAMETVERIGRGWNDAKCNEGENDVE